MKPLLAGLFLAAAILIPIVEQSVGIFVLVASALAGLAGIGKQKTAN